MRKLSLLLPFAGLLLAAGAALAGALEDAIAHRDAGRYEAALPLFEKAVQEAPESADAALGLAQTLNGLGRYADAAQAATAGLAANPEHAGLLVERARAHLLIADAGDAAGEDSALIMAAVAEADFSLKAALKADPRSADARVLSAKVYRYQGGGASDQSRDLLLEVVADFPDHFDAHWDLGRHHLQRGAMVQKDPAAAGPHWRDAQKHFARCVAIDPKSGAAHWELANALAWQGRTECWKSYAAAAELLPGNERVLNQLYRWSGGDKAARVAAFQKVAAARPGEPPVAIFLAWAQHEAGDTKAGVATLEAAAKASPGSPSVPLHRGHLLLADGDAAGAVEAYEKSIAAAETYVKSLYDDVNVKATSGTSPFSLAQREKLWTALWVKWPDAADAPNNAGLHYRDAVKDYAKSHTWYERAAAAAPDSPQIQNDTALILDQYLGRHAEAEPYYRRAIAAGGEQGRNWRGGDIEDTGYRDALNNFGRMLANTKRWADLRRFCEEDLPEGHPARAGWLAAAERGAR